MCPPMKQICEKRTLKKNKFTSEKLLNSNKQWGNRKQPNWEKVKALAARIITNKPAPRRIIRLPEDYYLKWQQHQQPHQTDNSDSSNSSIRPGAAVETAK